MFEECMLSGVLLYRTITGLYLQVGILSYVQYKVNA